MYWFLDTQLIIETDALDYTLTVIFSIITNDNEVYPVTFHSYTFSAPKLNYDIYDKELFATFKAFQI